MSEYISAIGQDSHAYNLEANPGSYTIKLGGIDIPSEFPIVANSDGDVMLHAITNAISGVTCRNILGKIADKMCLEEGITDSKKYLEVAMNDLSSSCATIVHLSMSIECKRPKISPHIESIRSSLSRILNLDHSRIGITATSGEELTSFGRGEGIQVLVVITVKCET